MSGLCYDIIFLFTILFQQPQTRVCLRSGIRRAALLQSGSRHNDRHLLFRVAADALPVLDTSLFLIALCVFIYLSFRYL